MPHSFVFFTNEWEYIKRWTANFYPSLPEVCFRQKPPLNPKAGLNGVPDLAMLPLLASLARYLRRHMQEFRAIVRMQFR